MNGSSRVEDQPAFVLHTYPFSETSLIAEVFSRDYGRLPLLARGARRPRSMLRGLIMAFQPLKIGWSGKGEVKTLTQAEWCGGVPLLTGRALFCAYYLNELLVSLLPREDAYEPIFAAYHQTLQCLAEQVREADIRRFEQILLQALGYGLTLDVEGDTRLPIQAGQHYLYQHGKGAVRAKTSAALTGTPVTGKTLLDMAKQDYDDNRTLAEGKILIRTLIEDLLGGKPLLTRRIFKDYIDDLWDRDRPGRD